MKIKSLLLLLLSVCALNGLDEIPKIVKKHISSKVNGGIKALAIPSDVRKSMQVSLASEYEKAISNYIDTPLTDAQHKALLADPEFNDLMVFFGKRKFLELNPWVLEEKSVGLRKDKVKAEFEGYLAPLPGDYALMDATINRILQSLPPT